MKVARMMLTMLNCIPSSCMRPSIHTQPTAKGRKAIRLISMLPSDSHRKTKTTKPQTKPI